MTLKQILAVLGTTTAIAAISGPQPQAESATERAHSREIHKLRDAQRHANHLRVLHESDTAAIAWGNERRPNRTVVFTLDEPIEKTTGEDIVEIELFSPGSDDDGTAAVTNCATSLALGTWWPTLEEARLPVHLAYRQVDGGPGLDERHRESRRTIVELILGASIYARNGDDRGERLVTQTMTWLRREGTVGHALKASFRTLLTDNGFDPDEWEAQTRDEIERTRVINNARWSGVAEQYARWRGHDPLGRRALGRGAAPIVLIDGRYLITMNTIRRQGGLKAPEKLFQTANAVVRDRIERLKTAATEEPTMNHTAATVMAASIALGTCSATTVATADDFPNWKGKWRKDSGGAEVVDEAHIRMKDSGRVFRMIAIGRLDAPAQITVAKEGIANLIDGKKLDCWWLPEPAAAGNPMAAAPDGTPLGSCGVRKVKYARCKDVTCLLQEMVVTNGYGVPEGGAWEQRTPNATEAMARLESLQTEARQQQIGIWAGQD